MLDIRENKIHVMIISDRLLNQANALANYLSSTGSIHVVGLAENKQQALSIAAYSGTSGRQFRKHPDTKPEASGHFAG